MPVSPGVTDPSGMAGAIVKYRIKLEPGESKELFAVIPYHSVIGESSGPEAGENPPQVIRAESPAEGGALHMLPQSTAEARRSFRVSGLLEQKNRTHPF